MQKILASIVAVVLMGVAQGAWSAALVEKLTGEVRLSTASGDVDLQSGQRLESGVTIRAGGGSHAVLRFDDGQVVVLNENTIFRIADYKYDQAKPKEDRSVLELVKGAFRFISGALSKRSQDTVKIQTGTATIGIRGTDFMAATGSLAVSVAEGAVSVTSGGGTALFSAGQIGFVSSATTLPVAVTTAQLPTSISAAFSQLGAIPVTAAPAASGAASGGTAQGAAAGSIAGVSTGTAVAVGAAVAGVAAVVSQDSNNTQSHHSHH